MTVRFRPEQHDIIEGYAGGKMAVLAVPGSGKTFTLAHLAARLVTDKIQSGEEVLIVTFTNSAVNSIYARVRGILQQDRRDLLAFGGFRVRTLHGLAHDIVRERPALAGLAEDFQIVDEKTSSDIQQEIVLEWMRANGGRLEGWLSDEVLDNERQARRVRFRNLPELGVSVAQRFIKHAKDNREDPLELREKLLPLEGNPNFEWARFCAEIYELYQRSLRIRGAVDFDDLVRMALDALDNDPDYLERLRVRWPYILEDEAQDSSKLQNEMLEHLSAGLNWVRVGDPNQAINTTFTTAEPRYLRDFAEWPDVTRKELSVSGRSAQPIYDLANDLVQWVMEARQLPPELHDALRAPPFIHPTPPGDPQVNPDARTASLYIDYEPGQRVSPEDEIRRVVGSLIKWLPANPDKTVAVLVPENRRGYKLVQEIKAVMETTGERIEYEELLRSTATTRQAAARLRTVLSFLADPITPRAPAALTELYRDVWLPVMYRKEEEEALAEELAKIAAPALRRCRRVEDFVWPAPGRDWLNLQTKLQDEPDARADLEDFRGFVRRWLDASIALPIDQLTITITNDLFTDPADIALGYKIASVLKEAGSQNPSWRLAEFAEELRVIAANERRFLGFDNVEGYEPKPGRLTVSTLHAAKGLEWDRVYIMAVNTYSFPAGLPEDEYLSERWFIRDDLNIEAETLAQLSRVMHGTPQNYVPGSASRQARFDYAAERLRLLYVGITRARSDLAIFWNMGRFWDRGKINQPALALLALLDY